MPKISTATRGELVKAVRERHRVASVAEKRRIPDEFVAITVYHRKHAIRVLNAADQRPVSTKRTARTLLYDDAVRQGLVVLWEASDRICARRLKALLPTLLPALERHGHLSLDPAVRTRLLAVSASTIDQLLSRVRSTSSGR